MTDTREEIEALLPFLANETLEGEELAAVEAAVAGDTQLQGELAALRAIRAKMQAEDLETSPGELGLARLMRDIDREDPFHEQGGSENVVPLRRLRVWQVAAVLVLGLGIGQVVLTSGSQTDPNGGEAGFELASGGAVGAEAAFRVIFAPETSEIEMRNFLLDAGLEIVAGPSSLGFYDLAPLDGDGGQDAARAALDGAEVLIETWEDISN